MPDNDTDEEHDRSDELGETAEKLGGIAGRLSQDTSEMTETTEATETAETTETLETNSGDSPQDSEMTETSEMSKTIRTSKTTETIEMNSTTETPVPGDDAFQLREHWNGRTIYLPDDVVDELDLQYQELNLEWQREHGEELPKNERFYPAVVRAALNRTSIRTELSMDQ